MGAALFAEHHPVFRLEAVLGLRLRRAALRRVEVLGDPLRPEDRARLPGVVGRTERQRRFGFARREDREGIVAQEPPLAGSTTQHRRAALGVVDDREFLLVGVERDVLDRGQRDGDSPDTPRQKPTRLTTPNETSAAITMDAPTAPYNCMEALRGTTTRSSTICTVAFSCSQRFPCRQRER